ncbi:hypothetical protein GEMRC1_002722 [Eukaryota sp. GEM-RC1]
MDKAALSTVKFNGLTNFITDVYNIQRADPTAVSDRIHKELSKIRKKFHQRSLTLYDKQKYILKLMLIHSLGFDAASLGHPVVTDLLKSSAALLPLRIGLYASSHFYSSDPDLAASFTEILLSLINHESMTVSSIAISTAASLITPASAIHFISPTRALATNQRCSRPIPSSNKAGQQSFQRLITDVEYQPVLPAKSTILLSRAVNLDPEAVSFEDLQDLVINQLKRKSTLSWFF